jgi:hypothetical protein
VRCFATLVLDVLNPVGEAAKAAELPIHEERTRWLI